MSNPSRPSNLGRNAVANWILFVFTAIVSFFLSPFLVRHLGTTQYGVWTLLAGLIGYLGLLDLGIRQAVNRFVAHHQAARAHEESSSVVSAAVRLFGLFGLLAILLSGVFAYFAPIFFNIPETLINDARIVVGLGGLTVAISLIAGAFGGAVTGLERFDVSCAVEILVTIVRTVAIVLALREGYGLVALACINLAASMVNCIASWAAARKLYPALQLRLRGSLLPQMRTILLFGASLSVVQLLSAVILSSDAMIIGVFLPMEAVTFFAIAGSLCVYAREVTRALSYLMTPRVSALVSIGSKRVGDEIVAVARFATLVAVPISATFVLRGESFINLWMGSEFGPASGDVLRILAVVVWLEAARCVVISSLTGMSKQRMLIPGIAVEAACKVALSVVLVGPLGILGVAIGTLIPSVLVNVAYIPHCLARATGVSVGQFHRQAVVLPTIACLPFALASVALEQLMPAGNLAVFFAQVISILPLVVLSAWFLCLTAEEKQRVGSQLRRLVGG